MKSLLTILFLSFFAISYSQKSYYRFEGNGNDDMGNYNLTAVGGAGYYASIKTEGSYSANVNTGAGQRFVTSGDFNFEDGGLTITIAFYHSATTGYNTLLDTRVNGTGNGMFIFLDCANRRVFFRTSDGTTTGDISTATNAYTRDAWNMVSIRLMDTEGSYGKIFINGSQSGTDTTLQSGWDLTAQFALGGDLAGNSFWGYFEQVSINTCALSNASIASLYTNITSNYKVACPTPPSAYNPIFGRHIRFYANGLERRDKPRPTGFRYWRLPQGYESQPLSNGDYFISSINGDDNNDGLTAFTPKQSEAALKTILANLMPGDTLLIERGSSFWGIDLNITRSGTSSEPIVIATYGTGELPILRGSSIMTSFTSQPGYLWYKNDARIVNKLDRFYDAWTGSWQDSDVRTNGIGWVKINGIYYGMSRYPNETPLSFETVDTTGYTYIGDNSNPFPSANLATGFTKVKVMQGEWSPVFATITYSNTNTLSLNPYDFLSVFGDLDPGTKGMVMNSIHPSISDRDGEYTLDPSNQRLWFYYVGDLNNQTVEVPSSDSVISITNASWIVLKDLDIRDSRLHLLKIHGGSNHTISGCRFSRCPGNALNIAGTTNITVKNCIISYADNGVAAYYTSGTRIEDTHINNIGIDPMLGDKNGASSNGIYFRDNLGLNYVTRCYMNQLGYCGIHSHDDDADVNSGGVKIKYNLGQEFCLKQTDGAFTYLVGNDDDAGSEVIGNVVIRSSTVSSWANANYPPIINAIYLDDHQSHTDVDSNSVWGVGLFNHFDDSYNNFRFNKVITNYYNNYANDGFHSEPVSENSIYVNFSNNEVVSTSNLTSLFTHIGRAGITNFSDCSTWTINNNKYFSYNSGQNFFAFSPAWVSWQYYTSLASWQTFTGKEASSQLKFNSTLSSTEAVMYVNYSPTSHTFNLGSATFVDYDGVSKSGTLTVPAYRSTILYKTGGTLDGDSNFYLVTP